MFAKEALELFCQIRQNCLTLEGSPGQESASPPGATGDVVALA